MIKKPYKATPLDNGLVRLSFEDDLDAEFYIRGAVTWPEGANAGFALLGAKDVNTGILWALEQYSFFTVEPTLDKVEKRFKGLLEFFQKCWKYHTRLFFWRQHEMLHRRYALQCWDHPMINPKPDFIQVKVDDVKLGDNILNEFIARKKVRAPKQSELYKHIVSRDEKRKLGISCLKTLIMGFEQFGYRKAA